jgi:DNA-binding PadR family transcriptional regulator
LKRIARKENDQHQSRPTTLERVQEVCDRPRQRLVRHNGRDDEAGVGGKEQKGVYAMKKSDNRRVKLPKIQRKDLLMTLLLEKGANEKSEPLDRIRIMKGLFLLSREVPKLANLFHFEPYLYGAVSFDVYTELDALEHDGFVRTTEEFSNERWNRYLLTSKGMVGAREASKNLPADIRDRIDSIKRYVTSKQTYELLKEIYAKYPAFAKRSVIRVSN